MGPRSSHGLEPLPFPEGVVTSPRAGETFTSASPERTREGRGEEAERLRVSARGRCRRTDDHHILQTAHF